MESKCLTKDCNEVAEYWGQMGQSIRLSGKTNGEPWSTGRVLPGLTDEDCKTWGLTEVDDAKECPGFTKVRSGEDACKGEGNGGRQSTPKAKSTALSNALPISNGDAGACKELVETASKQSPTGGIGVETECATPSPNGPEKPTGRSSMSNASAK